MSVFFLPVTGKMGVVDPMLRTVEGEAVRAVRMMAGQLLRRWRGADDEIGELRSVLRLPERRDKWQPFSQVATSFW